MSDIELTPEQLREAIHRPGLTRKDQLLLLLLSLGAASQSEVRTAGLQAGLRAIRNWNITQILQSMTGQVVQTPAGWELLDHAKQRARELAGGGTTPPTVDSKATPSHPSTARNADDVE